MLFEAARRGDDPVVGALIRAGVDLEAVNARGHSALVLATYNGRLSTAALLLGAGAAPDGTGAGDAPLIGVAFKGHADIAALLLDRGADPDARGGAGRTALMTAALFDQAAVVELLLARGADPSLADHAGATARSLALGRGDEVIADRLGRQVQAL